MIDLDAILAMETVAGLDDSSIGDRADAKAERKLVDVKQFELPSSRLSELKLKAEPATAKLDGKLVNLRKIKVSGGDAISEVRS